MKIYLRVKEGQRFVAHENGQPLEVLGPGRHWFIRGQVDQVHEPTELGFLNKAKVQGKDPWPLEYKVLRTNEEAHVFFNNSGIAHKNSTAKPAIKTESFWYLREAVENVVVVKTAGQPPTATSTKKIFELRNCQILQVEPGWIFVQADECKPITDKYLALAPAELLKVITAARARDLLEWEWTGTQYSVWWKHLPNPTSAPTATPPAPAPTTPAPTATTPAPTAPPTSLIRVKERVFEYLERLKAWLS